MSGDIRLEGSGTCVMASLDLNSEHVRYAKIKLDDLKTRVGMSTVVIKFLVRKSFNFCDYALCAAGDDGHYV